MRSRLIADSRNAGEYLFHFLLSARPHPSQRIPDDIGWHGGELDDNVSRDLVRDSARDFAEDVKIVGCRCFADFPC